MPTPPLGNPNQIDASDIDIDLPMGKPPGAGGSGGGSLEQEEEGTIEDEDEEEIGNEFKQLVTKLVRQGKLSLYCVFKFVVHILCTFMIWEFPLQSLLQLSLTLISSSFP